MVGERDDRNELAGKLFPGVSGVGRSGYFRGTGSPGFGRKGRASQYELARWGGFLLSHLVSPVGDMRTALAANFTYFHA